MRNLLITISFDGTAYHGFQVQENAITVCEVFQNAVEKVLRKRWDVKGCSRTDSGVHARKYCLSMMIDHPIPCEGLLLALNRKLPDDIAVLSVIDVPMDFHARYTSIGKQYTYLVHNSRVKDPFSPTKKYHFTWDIDHELLDREAKYLVGKHDFSSFCTRAHLIEDKVRTITDITVTREGELVKFVIEGDGFLYNMVRIIVGTLLAIPMGRVKSGELAEILEAKDRQRAGKTAPAHGLYLTDVIYPETLYLGGNNADSC